MSRRQGATCYLGDLYIYMGQHITEMWFVHLLIRKETANTEELQYRHASALKLPLLVNLLYVANANGQRFLSISAFDVIHFLDSLRVLGQTRQTIQSVSWNCNDLPILQSVDSRFQDFQLIWKSKPYSKSEGGMNPNVIVWYKLHMRWAINSSFKYSLAALQSVQCWPVQENSRIRIINIYHSLGRRLTLLLTVSWRAPRYRLSPCAAI